MGLKFVTNVIWRNYEGVSGSHGYVYTKATDPNMLNIYLIYFHGTNGDAIRAITRMENIGCHKFFIEYPGYSFLSKSLELTSKTLHEDLSSILTEIFENIPTKGKIIMHGRSIGTGVMCPYITNYIDRVEGIILETPFISLGDIMYTYLGYVGSGINYILNLDDWNLSTLNYIKDTTTKVLIVSCGQDYVTPVSHSKILYEQLKKSPDIQLIILTNESHQIKFKKIEKDVNNWIKEKFI